MNKQTFFLSVACSFTIATSSVVAAPLKAVIGLNSSQVIENTQYQTTLTLPPIQGSLLPLDKQFDSFTQPMTSNLPNWSEQLGHSIQVDSKQRALSYTGTLKAIDTRSQTFTLSIQGKEVQLPVNDFYLVPLEKVIPKDTDDTAYQGLVSYQSDELSWNPKRTFIINQDKVSVINMASIENASAKSITLQNSLLHYSHQAIPRFKTERTSLLMSKSESPQVDYDNSEITYPIKQLVLPANSTTLTELSRETVKVDSNKGVATIFTSSAMSGTDLSLNFQNTLAFTLKQTALPGQYQTYWLRDGLLIPGDMVSVSLARADQTLKVTTNQNLDITGKLKLISASSNKLPATQEWMLTLKNHANSQKHYSVTQNTRGVIDSIEGNKAALGKSIEKTANSVQFDGVLEAHESKTIRYTLKLKE